MEKLLDNSTRGRRTIFWMKSWVVLTILLCILSFLVVLFLGKASQEPSNLLSIIVLFLPFGIFVVGALFLFSLFMQYCYWIAWMYRAVTNLRIIGHTRFSPLVAVIISVLPYVGFVLHYFVIRDIVDGIDAKLGELGVARQPVPVNCISTFAVLNLLGMMSAMFISNPSAGIIVAVLGLAALCFYISALQYCVRQEKLLLTAGQEEIIRRRVEEVLKQRETEKAASQVQEATFERDVPPPDNYS